VTADIAEFIRARLDEDKAIAEDAGRVGGGEWNATLDGPDEGKVDADKDIYPVAYAEGRPTWTQARHIARHDPARALRDVEAKRLILFEHLDNGNWARSDDGTLARISHGNQCTVCVEDSTGVGSEFAEMERFPCPTLRLLASEWSSHADYRAEWKP
jgi:hypothetical protein